MKLKEIIIGGVVLLLTALSMFFYRLFIKKSDVEAAKDTVNIQMLNEKRAYQKKEYTQKVKTIVKEVASQNKIELKEAFDSRFRKKEK